MGRNVEKRKSFKKGVMRPENQKAFKPMMDSDTMSKKDSKSQEKRHEGGWKRKKKKKKK